MSEPAFLAATAIWATVAAFAAWLVVRLVWAAVDASYANEDRHREHWERCEKTGLRAWRRNYTDQLNNHASALFDRRVGGAP